MRVKLVSLFLFSQINNSTHVFVFWDLNEVNIFISVFLTSYKRKKVCLFFQVNINNKAEFIYFFKNYNILSGIIRIIKDYYKYNVNKLETKSFTHGQNKKKQCKFTTFVLIKKPFTS